MEQGHIDYLKNIGIDISHSGHPFAEEFITVTKTRNSSLIRCFEHLLLMLILDIETIKKYNLDDYNHYIKRLRATNSSFWGQRFEIFWYSALISKFEGRVTDLRRGEEGEEADFVFKYNGEQISIETTSVVYELTSSMTNPISKMKRTIGEKEKKKYANKNCCLIIDYSNLSFYRKIINNFTLTISELIEQLNSKFGIILFQYGFHSDDKSNPKYLTQVFDWTSDETNSVMRDFLHENFSQTDTGGINKIYFRVS